MARYDMWLAMQRQLLDNGAAAQIIVLEGPDGGRFATWPIGFANLEESVQGMLQSLVESLPKGRHQCRLVSYDSQQAQLSSLPVVVTGAGEAAADQGSARLAQERSNSITISNAEKQINAAMKVVDHLSEVLEASLAAHEKKDRVLEEMIEATQTTNRELIRAQGREERLNAMFKSLEPLLGVAVNFAANFAVDWLEKKGAMPGQSVTKESTETSQPPEVPAVENQRQVGKELGQGIPSGLALQPTLHESKEPVDLTWQSDDLPAVLGRSPGPVSESTNGEAGPSPGDQPAGTCDSRSDPQSGEPRTDAEGCTQGNGRDNPRRDGRAPKDPKPPRTTGRRGSLVQQPGQSRKAKRQ